MEDENELYILLEASYVKREKEKNKLNFNEEDIFPYDWFKIRDYKLKIDILLEATEKNMLIKDTESYKELKNNTNN